MGSTKTEIADPFAINGTNSDVIRLGALSVDRVQKIGTEIQLDIERKRHSDGSINIDFEGLLDYEEVIRFCKDAYDTPDQIERAAW